ncbi:MAG: AraC family transcriptional regulator [Bacteroidales bacterium]
MSIIELVIELLFDIVAIVLGITLVVQNNGNMQRFYWGIMSICIGLLFSWENINWIFTVVLDTDYEYQDIFNIEKMLKWFAPASIISLFPLASLRPGHLNPKRAIVYFLPFLIVLTISVFFLTSNPIITKVYSVSEFFLNFDKFDIKLRLLIFVLSLIIPYIYFFHPLINHKTIRKVSFNMYLFLAFILALSVFYIFFTLFINAFFFNAFGVLSVLFAITFSVLHLRYENPLSIHIGNTNQVSSTTTILSPTFFEIDNYFKENNTFINSNYTIKEIAHALQIKEQEITKSIQSAGYTGFREYINFKRLEYFKTIASQNPNKTIKELMFACGFTSRTTFYRVFAEQYGISPLKYVNSLKLD